MANQQGLQISGFFKADKAVIEALTGVAAGTLGFATDTLEFGFYDGSDWHWDAGGSGSGTPGGSDKQVQYNNAGAFAGMKLQHTGTSSDITLETESNGDDGMGFTLKGKDATGNGRGGGITLKSGASAGTGMGRNISLEGGDAEDSFAGAADFVGGNSIDGAGGPVNLSGGNSVNGAGGPVAVKAGNSTNHIGGDVVFEPGQGGSENGKFRFRDPGSGLDMILDLSAITGPRILESPDADGILALLDDVNDLAASVTTALAGKQPLDSDLTAIAALSPSNDDIIQRKAGAWTNRTLAQLITDLTSGLSAIFTPLSYLDTDGTLAANSDSKVATQKATKTYVDNAVVGLMDLKGSTDASGDPNYPAASKGDAYYVTVAGKVGGGSGKSVDVGDVYVASADNAGGTEASVGTSWFVLEHNLTGALLAANNLSDVASAATARTNLGLAIGTNVQAHSSDLAAIAGLTPSNDDILQRKAGAWTNRTIAQLITDLTSGLSALFAPIAKGVTNGDSHDHSGGDGAQIDHTTLSSIGTNTHATIDAHLAAAAPHSGHSLTSHTHSTLYMPLDTWIPISDTWTRTGNHTFTVSGDVTAVYRKGTKIRYKDGGAFEYGVIYSSSHAAGTTTVTLIPTSDYAMAAATITDKYLSYSEVPEGFPHVFNWAPNYTANGTGSPAFGSVATAYAKWQPLAKGLFWQLRATGTTSGSTVTQINASLPCNAAAIGGNGTFAATCGDTAGDVGRGILDVTNHIAGFAKLNNANWGIGANRAIIGQGYFEY